MKEIPINNEILSNREKFDKLFEKITGVHPDQAHTNEDGWLFMQPRTKEESEETREELTRLAGPSGWKNNLVDDEYEGYWIKRPE